MKINVKKYDYFVIFAVLAVGILLLAFPFLQSNTKPSELTVVIKTDDSEISLPFSTPTSYLINSNGHTLKLEITGKDVYVLETDCKDKYCKNMGKINKAGSSIICVPSKTIVEIVSAKSSNSSVDALVG